MARHIIDAHYKLQSECSACGSAELAHVCPIRPKDIVGKRVTVKQDVVYIVPMFVLFVLIALYYCIVLCLYCVCIVLFVLFVVTLMKR